MNIVKTIIRPLYIALRILFFPLLLLFRPTGARPESIVGSATVAVFILLIQPIIAARLGAGYAILTTSLGTILAYAFLMWGKEFEQKRPVGS
jgi:hypothetical protein